MLIYEKSCHGLYYDDLQKTKHYFSLAIQTLELIVDCFSGELLYAIGYFPLIRAKKSVILLPKCKGFGFVFDKKIKENATPSVAYNFEDFFPKSKQIFTSENLFYDKEVGIIKYGKDNYLTFRHIKINDNLCIAVNADNEIQCLYIKPDKFI